ncbi:MAG TPA: 50S ribosomal protein L25 [Spirochaetia bacterium]|nr:MAG: hypothetical protein A2Y41_09465 [Spirochaetes bacterium GWB1_36_13]HCL56386.1 50S ribosomal protein L25 [Spirochaetia bacterium]
MEVLKLEERSTGTGINHKLRREGQVPGIIYGGEKCHNVSANYTDFIKVFKIAGEHQLIELNLNGKKMLSLLKDIQIHPVKDTFIHFDMLEVIPDKIIKTKIPLEFTGTPKGLISGGILEELNTSMYIETQAKNLPEAIQVDISALNVGDSIHFKDIKIPANVRLIDSPDTVAVLIAGYKEQTESAETEEKAEEKK